MGIKLAIVGATGVVGRKFLTVLAERKSSNRSVGVIRIQEKRWTANLI